MTLDQFAKVALNGTVYDPDSQPHSQSAYVD